MEFVTLGKQCAKLTCNRANFKPSKCNFCNLDFCRDHYKMEEHDCLMSIDEPNKPNAKRLYAICPSGTNPLNDSSQHCMPNTKLPNPKTITPNALLHKRKDCIEKFRRNEAQTVVVLCPFCNKMFCLKHKHTDVHQCETFRLTPNKRSFGTYIYTGWKDKDVGSNIDSMY